MSKMNRIVVCCGIALVFNISGCSKKTDTVVEKVVYIAEATVKSDALNMRAAPDAGSAVVTTLYKGDKLTVSGDITDNWVAVSYNGKMGFANSKYLDIEQIAVTQTNTEQEIVQADTITAEKTVQTAATESANEKTSEEIAVKAPKKGKWINVVVYILLPLAFIGLFIREAMFHNLKSQIVWVSIAGIAAGVLISYFCRKVVPDMRFLQFDDYKDIYINCALNGFIIAWSASFGVISGILVGFFTYLFSLSALDPFISVVYPCALAIFAGCFVYANINFDSFTHAKAYFPVILKAGFLWNIIGSIFVYFDWANMVYRINNPENPNKLLAVLDAVTLGTIGTILDIKDFFVEWIPHFWLGILLGSILSVILIIVFYFAKWVTNYDVDQSPNALLALQQWSKSNEQE